MLNLHFLSYYSIEIFFSTVALWNSKNNMTAYNIVVATRLQIATAKGCKICISISHFHSGIIFIRITIDFYYKYYSYLLNFIKFSYRDKIKN